MSEPLRAHDPDEHDSSDAGAHAPATRDLSLVESVRAQAPARVRATPLQLLSVASLLALNLYLWLGNPAWLAFPGPPAPSIDDYANGGRIAVWVQRQRIEEYRRVQGTLPSVASQAGPVVHGVAYTPNERTQTYQLAAGEGPNAIVYRSSDPPDDRMERTLAQAGLVARAGR